MSGNFTKMLFAIFFILIFEPLLFRCVTDLVSLNIEDMNGKKHEGPGPEPTDQDLDVHEEVLQHIRDTRVSVGMRALSVLRFKIMIPFNLGKQLDLKK